MRFQELSDLPSIHRSPLEEFLGKWLASYLVPEAFVGSRGQEDRDDIVAQIALYATEQAAQGTGRVTEREFSSIMPKPRLERLSGGSGRSCGRETARIP